MNILLVEDEEATAAAIRGALIGSGHRVTVATDGLVAWRMVREGHFPVVLSDWIMPGLDGLDLCRRIRGQAGRPYTYFVMMTGRGGYDDRLKALDSGVDDFLSKPIDRRELAARMEIARRLLDVQEELERKNIALRELATTDELTGLKNRRSFSEALESHFSLAARQGVPLSLILLDVDQFKSYNDAFGHPAGDALLRGLAELLRGSTRDHDTVARHGGEEFAILLPATGPVVARGLAERLRAAIERRDWPLRGVTASLGIATMTLETGTASELVEQADVALYASKHRGRNCVSDRGDGTGVGVTDGGTIRRRPPANAAEYETVLAE